MKLMKLIDFCISRGRAEPIRWVFAHLESTGVDYEDIRIPKADWPAKKGR